MNTLQMFKHEELGSVRAMLINDEPWFIGRDVAEALGYGLGNKKSKALTNAIKDHVDEEDKYLMPYKELVKYQNGDLKGISHYGATIINESGLYSLIMNSTLDSAKKFKYWVTHEVLPSIRKHGAYVTDEKAREMLLDPDTILEIANELRSEQRKNSLQTVENSIERANCWIEKQKHKQLMGKTLENKNTTERGL